MIGIYDMFPNWEEPKRPADAKLVKKYEQEVNGVKEIVEVWEGKNYKSIETSYVYINKLDYTKEELLDQLKLELMAAVQSENFELAAELRDQIKSIKDAN